MEPDDKIHVEHKIDYLKLALKIAKIRYQGDESPKKLLFQAHEAGRLACMPKEELEKI